MNRIRRPISLVAIAVFIAVLCATSLFAQSQPAQQSPSAPPADLDAYVARSLQTFNVPGISVAIVKDGKLVLAKGFGVRKLGDPTPVDENTLFGIGSNTKAFTSAALASLVDAGKITWDEPVYQAMPGFEMYDPYVAHEMTIRDLLTHRSGMGLGEGDLLFWPHSTYTRDEIIYRLRFMKPASSFRSHFAYDNLLYLAAGQIIPAVTGQSWDDYIREHILVPLSMNTTTLSNTFKPGDNFASPHSLVDGKLQSIEFVNLDNAGPAGAINSSAAEMSKWVLLQLNRGKFPDRDGRLFSAQQSREMWSPQTILPIGNDPHSPLAALHPNFADYGLGWFLSDYHGRKLVGHSGGVAGFVTRVLLVPEENLGIIVLTNAEQTGAFESVAYHILDSYFGIPATDWNAAFKAASDQEEKEAAEIMKQHDTGRAANSQPSLAPEKYAGVYNDAWYGTSSIRLEDGKLVFRLDHTPKAVGDMQHWQFDTFKIHWRDRTIEDAFATFTLKPDGSIDHFTMLPVSPLADFSFDYQDLYFKPAPPAQSGAASMAK
jgi:CubicO group peptidase (beta-lactamase class C family)